MQSTVTLLLLFYQSVLEFIIGSCHDHTLTMHCVPVAIENTSICCELHQVMVGACKVAKGYDAKESHNRLRSRYKSLSNLSLCTSKQPLLEM